MYRAYRAVEVSVHLNDVFPRLHAGARRCAATPEHFAVSVPAVPGAPLVTKDRPHSAGRTTVEHVLHIDALERVVAWHRTGGEGQGSANRQRARDVRGERKLRARALLERHHFKRVVVIVVPRPSSRSTGPTAGRDRCCPRSERCAGRRRCDGTPPMSRSRRWFATTTYTRAGLFPRCSVCPTP